MGWLEFAVIVGCGLLGFIIMNAVIDKRRAEKGRQDDGTSGSGSAHHEEATRNGNRKQEGSNDNVPRPWWEVLNIDKCATSDQIKKAFRREISKYHPDRVEGLGIELRHLAERKAKEVNRAYTIAKEQRRFS
jgi:DnaJ-domain-containing protein 1